MHPPAGVRVRAGCQSLLPMAKTGRCATFMATRSPIALWRTVFSDLKLHPAVAPARGRAEPGATGGDPPHRARPRDPGAGGRGRARGDEVGVQARAAQGAAGDQLPLGRPPVRPGAMPDPCVLFLRVHRLGYPKTRWRFTLAGEPWFCVAGLWPAGGGGGPESFTMLTTAPGGGHAALSRPPGGRAGAVRLAGLARPGGRSRAASRRRPAGDPNGGARLRRPPPPATCRKLEHCLKGWS